MHTEVIPLEELVSEQYHSEEFIFPNAILEIEDIPQKEMAHETEKQETFAFRFPIKGSNEETKMKNIPHSSLPNFHVLSKEDPDTFLFTFNVLCRSCDYVSDAQKLKLFASTLKNSTLHWFMGLGRDNIRTWDQMTHKFLENNQDYCKDKTKEGGSIYNDTT
jgi:hypothetical protein